MHDQGGRRFPGSAVEINGQPGDGQDGDQAPPFEKVEDQPPGKPMQDPG